MAGRTPGGADLVAEAALSAERLSARLAAEHLAVLGGFRPEEGDGMPAGIVAVLLLGPAEPGFWAHLKSAPEWGSADPVDSWSRRVIGRIACDFGGKAWFPFGGPPYHPFYAWALRTHRAFASPVRLLVQADQGLMVSFRGALALRFDPGPAVGGPPPAPNPCDACADKPCLTACPAGAMGRAGYDVPACHAHLDRNPDGPCLSGGCLVRRACPLSEPYARLPEQSAYHMRRFHKPGTP